MYAIRSYYVESSAVDMLFAGPSAGQDNGGLARESALAGVVGRVQYDFDQKYILQLSGRYDGNDNFAPGKKWGFFPAIATGWVISSEPFMESISDRISLNNLKLRLSYGETGIVAGVNRFGYLATYNLVSNAINIGNVLYNGFSEGNLVSPNELSWYSRNSNNIGLDFAFAENSVVITSYSIHYTKLYDVAPITSGDTAFRSTRLVVADTFNFNQGLLYKRLLVTIPIFMVGIALTQINFAIIWRYFGWSNQVLATIVLWATVAYMKSVNQSSWFVLIPATFMTAVVTSYILLAPEGFYFPYLPSLLAGIITAMGMFAAMGPFHAKLKLRTVFTLV